MLGRNALMGPPGQEGSMQIKQGENPHYQVYEHAKAMNDKATKAGNLIKMMRMEMDELASKGDTVTHEDIMGVAGRLVGNGVPAKEMALLLAGMPASVGQALAGWVSQHDELLAQQEVLVNKMQRLTRFDLAQASLKGIMAAHLDDEQQAPPPMPDDMAPEPGALGPQQGGALAPGGAPGGMPSIGMGQPMPNPPPQVPVKPQGPMALMMPPVAPR